MKKTTTSVVLASPCPGRKRYKLNIILITFTLLILIQGAAFAQSPHHFRLTGIVLSSTDNQPLPGATIAVRDSKSQVSTDATGRFELLTRDSSGILTVSFIGFKHQSIPFLYSNTGPYLIKLIPSPSELKEVVVSTGYQNIPRERATGSFVQLDSALVNRRVGSDVISRLEGVVPGLLFNRNTSASSTGTLDINIRGHSTLFSNDQPLIVLDNFPYDGDLNNINPNDVASITVLKDAAAASIWGVRSGNGVIVITTKKGRLNQKLSIEFNANYTAGNKPNLRYDQNFLDANNFIDVEQSLFSKGYYNSKITSGYQAISPVVQILAAQRAGTISGGDAKAQIDAFRTLDIRNDIDQYFYRKSSAQQYSLNFRGGGDKSDFYLSLGYDDNLSSQVGNGNNRITLNGNFNFYPIKNLQVSTGIIYTKSQAKNNSTLAGINSVSGINNIYPYARFSDDAGNNLSIVHGYPLSFTNSQANAQFLDWNYRPLDELKYADNKFRSFDNRVNLGLKYTFFKGFSADLKYVYENAQSNISNIYTQDTYYTRDLINRFTQIASDKTLSYPVPLGGILQQSDASLTSDRLRGQLNYSKEWNTDHSITGILGSEWSEAINQSNNQAPAFGYDKETKANYSQINFLNTYTLNPRNLGSSQIPNGQSFAQTTDHFISYFANAAYTFQQKYIFSISGRIDKSNLFGVNTNQKAIPLYSAGLAWNLSKERFYKLDWLPDLKLRTTYGYNGNINKSATAVTTLRQQSSSYLTGIPYNIIANPGNPDLRWEKYRMINIGLDFGSKNQIITGSADLYYKKSENLFGNSALPPSTGYSSFFGNTASTKGHGVDITINTHNINQKRFKWMTNLIYSYAVDKVVSYDVSVSATSYLRGGAGNGGQITPLAGAPLFAVYSLKSGPLTHLTGDPQGYLNGKLSTDYAAIINNTGINDLIYNGSSRPTSFGSIRNTFVYNAWSLSFNAIYKLGYYFRRSSIQYEALYSSWLGHSDYTRRWQQPGDEVTTNVPSAQLPPVNSNRELFYTFSQSLIDKGDHIRLQDITLNYDLTKKLWRNSPLASLTIYGYVNNVGLLWKANHDGLDPDVYSIPGGRTNLPLARTYSIGLKTNFK